MHIRIDRESSVPAYMQVYNELRNRIISGAFVHGAKLPSKRELARDCLVSLPTIEHAYQLLCDEGFCEMRLQIFFRCLYRCLAKTIRADASAEDENGRYKNTNDFLFVFHSHIPARILPEKNQRLKYDSSNTCDFLSLMYHY